MLRRGVLLFSIEDTGAKLYNAMNVGTPSLVCNGILISLACSLYLSSSGDPLKNK